MQQLLIFEGGSDVSSLELSEAKLRSLQSATLESLGADEVLVRSLYSGSDEAIDTVIERLQDVQEYEILEAEKGADFARRCVCIALTNISIPDSLLAESTDQIH